MANVTPTEMGGHNWHAMSFNPRTGLAYYPAMHQARTYTDVGVDPATYRVTNWLVGVGVGGGNTGSTHPSGVLATLQAWDPVRQTLAWEVPLPGVYNPGTMTTAGNLVFQGRVDGRFVAYRADTGEELWSYDLGLGITAPPVTYAVNGRQYVALLVGFGSLMARGAEAAALGWEYGLQTRRLVAFSLEGTATLPPQPPPHVPGPIDADFEVDRALAARGAVVFGQRCSLCHGGGAVAGGLTPDLRSSLIVTRLEDFASVVRDGTRAVNGMPQYAEITLDELTSLQHYIRARAEADLATAAR
jgi:quinohemoprotein ethanol dehydrogenase